MPDGHDHDGLWMEHDYKIKMSNYLFIYNDIVTYLSMV